MTGFLSRGAQLKLSMLRQGSEHRRMSAPPRHRSWTRPAGWFSELRCHMHLTSGNMLGIVSWFITTYNYHHVPNMNVILWPIVSPFLQARPFKGLLQFIGAFFCKVIYKSLTTHSGRWRTCKMRTLPAVVVQTLNTIPIAEPIWRRASNSLKMFERQINRAMNFDGNVCLQFCIHVSPTGGHIYGSVAVSLQEQMAFHIILPSREQ